jgi:hypothetical protein
MARNKVVTKKRKPKEHDGNWSSDSCSSPKKKGAAARLKHDDNWSSDSCSSPKKKGAAARRNNKKQCSSSNSSAVKAKTSHHIIAVDDKGGAKSLFASDNEIITDTGNTSPRTSPRTSTVTAKITEEVLGGASSMTRPDSGAGTRSKKITSVAQKVRKARTTPEKATKPGKSKTLWIIEANKDRPHTNQRTKLIKKMECESKDVVNHRRHQGFKGELLVVYTDGQRYWCLLHGAYIDIPDQVNGYMSANNLSLADMGYAIDDPDLMGPDEAMTDDDSKNSTGKNIVTINTAPCNDGENKNSSNNNIVTMNNTPDAAPCNDGENKNSSNNNIVTMNNTPDELINSTDHVEIAERVANTEVNNTLMESTLPNAEVVTSAVSEDTDLTCCHDHSNVHSFIAEYNSLYCTKGNDFDGVHCANKECDVLFVHTINRVAVQCLRPTALRPLYSCPNRRVRCPYALCYSCYSKVIDTYKRTK